MKNENDFLPHHHHHHHSKWVLMGAFFEHGNGNVCIFLLQKISTVRLRDNAWTCFARTPTRSLSDSLPLPRSLCVCTTQRNLICTGYERWCEFRMLWRIKWWHLVRHTILYMCLYVYFVCFVCTSGFCYIILYETGKTLLRCTESRHKLNKQSGLLLMWLIQFSFSIKINIVVYCKAATLLRMFIVWVRDLSAQLNKWYAFCFWSDTIYCPRIQNIIQAVYFNSDQRDWPTTTTIIRNKKKPCYTNAAKPLD